MKILPFSSGAWLLFCCAVYALVGLSNVFVYTFTKTEYIEAVWMIIMGMPLFISMKWLVRVDTVWEQMKYD